MLPDITRAIRLQILDDRAAELTKEIAALPKHIAEIEKKLTSKGIGDPNDPTVAVAMTKFGELDLEQKIAERLYGESKLEVVLVGANALPVGDVVQVGTVQMKLVVG